MSVTFNGTVLKDQTVNATGIQVPEEVVTKLGKGRNPKVKITLQNDAHQSYDYRGIVQTSSGRFMLSLSAENREAAGLHPGDPVQVTLELDTEPRTLDVPDDLKAALSAKAGALEAFEALSFSKRKEFVRQVEEAKAQETRNRRISNVVTQMDHS
jgi:hypothetical protein